MSTKSDLQDRLSCLEIPGHNFPLADWAELASALNDYHTPPLPEPASARTRSERVEIMVTREAAGQHLYHPADSWRRKDLIGVRIAIPLDNGRGECEERWVPDQPSLRQAVLREARRIRRAMRGRRLQLQEA